MPETKEIVQLPRNEPPSITTEPATADLAFVQMIERVSRSPDVRLDVVQGLVAMRNDELMRVAKTAFNQAMAAAQGEMTRVAADANNPQTKSKYASYAALDRMLRPIYSKHGFALSFDTGDAPAPDMVRVLCDVSHASGYTRTYKADMPADGKGAKGGDVMTKTHATGAAFTYGARYLLKLIFNVAVGEADDDGNSATSREPITEAQERALQSKLMEHDIPLAKFFKVLGIDKLADLPASRFGEAEQTINDAIAIRAQKKREKEPA